MAREQPITFVLAGDETRVLVVPRLEVEHAEAKATLDRVQRSAEYSGEPRREDLRADAGGSWPASRTRVIA